jgi:GcrA cell cycle regulator
MALDEVHAPGVTYRWVNLSPWTVEREEQLRRYWAEGLSASQIAGRLNCGISRNAVIGKANRLKLPARTARMCCHPKVAKPKPPRIPKVKPSRGKPRVEYVGPPLPVPEVPPEQRIKFAALTRESCRYPLGHVGEAEFGFCSHPKHSVTTPYCLAHYLLCTTRRC